MAPVINKLILNKNKLYKNYTLPLVNGITVHIWISAAFVCFMTVTCKHTNVGRTRSIFVCLLIPFPSLSSGGTQRRALFTRTEKLK